MPCFWNNATERRRWSAEVTSSTFDQPWLRASFLNATASSWVLMQMPRLVTAPPPPPHPPPPPPTPPPREGGARPRPARRPPPPPHPRVLGFARAHQLY